jgi:histidine triad (HIT) family protein
MGRSPLLKSEFLSKALQAARWQPLKPIVSLFYPLMFRFLPMDPVCDNAHWAAFHHPQPQYPLHILILPKQSISCLTDAPSDDHQLYADLMWIVQRLISDFQLEDRGYRLITNGGQHQSIPIWHWHLVCDEPCQGSDDPGVNHA